MILKRIKFQNYKAFREEQYINIKPITILLGKNSSGKSSIAKLLLLIENSLSGKINDPLVLRNGHVELGASFRDLVYNREEFTPVDFTLEFENNTSIFISILQPIKEVQLIVNKWEYRSDNGKIYSLIYNPLKKNYLTENKVECECVFKGFFPELVSGDVDFSFFDFKKFELNVDYIGPFRKLPSRNFTLNGESQYNKVGEIGENAYQILARSYRNNTETLLKVGAWYKQYLGSGLNISYKEPYYEVNVINDSLTEINITDVGQGMSQVLPLVTRAYMKDFGSVIVSEQPVLHLHPAAHGDVAELFVNSALENSSKYIIETHSENFILRLKRLIVDKESELSSEDVVINWIYEDEEGDGNQIDEITINKNGVFSDWPEGVFSENIDEIRAIREALNK